jgi:regulator of cell morphogenesis and NO signaling
MNIDATATVGELAGTIPHARRVLEKYGIDYCCGGGKSLADACTVSGADLSTVIRAISKNEAKNNADRNYYDLSQRDLTEHIINTHHEFTRTEIRRLSALSDKVVSVHGSRHPELLQLRKTFGDLAEDLMPHMMKEENVLFPYIVTVEAQSASGVALTRPPFMTVQNPVRMMQFEHDLAGELLRELRRITSNYTAPADSCVSYKTLYEALRQFEEDLHLHIHLENNVLFPRAIEMESRASDSERTVV